MVFHIMREPCNYRTCCIYAFSRDSHKLCVTGLSDYETHNWDTYPFSACSVFPFGFFAWEIETVEGLLLSALAGENNITLREPA